MATLGKRVGGNITVRVRCLPRRGKNMQTLKAIVTWFWAEYIYPMWEFIKPGKDDDDS